MEYKIFDITIKNNPKVVVQGKDTWYDSPSIKSWEDIPAGETLDESLTMYESIDSAGTYKAEITIIDKTTGKVIATAEKEQKIPQA